MQVTCSFVRDSLEKAIEMRDLGNKELITRRVNSLSYFILNNQNKLSQSKTETYILTKLYIAEINILIDSSNNCKELSIHIPNEEIDIAFEEFVKANWFIHLSHNGLEISTTFVSH